MFKIILVIAMLALYVAAQDQTAETLKFDSEINADGSYAYSYETSNGIAAQESGVGGVSANGEAKWVAPDGTPIQFSYVANEGGFQPTGDHIPQQPPHVARLIEWLEAHPSDDDGSYKPKP